MMLTHDIIGRAEIQSVLICIEVILSIFQHGVELIGASRITFLEEDYDRMVWYVLNNCPEVEPYMEYVIPCMLLACFID